MKHSLLWLLLLVGSVPVWATVPVVPFTVTYTCTGGYGPYSFAFPISAANTLTVTLNGVLLSSTSYTVIPVNNNYNNGGNVTLGGGFPCTTGTLVLTRVTPINQLTQFYDNMPALPVVTGNSVDKLTEIAQELNGLVGQIISGAGVAFSAITSGTNITATMTVGSGASLAPTSATVGSISANKINGTALSGLATGVLKNTTTTGVPSIAVYTDIVAMWASGSCSGFLKNDGTCSTPSGGTVTTTGSPASPELTCFSGPTSITNCNLSGDITTTNTAATTLATVNSGPGSCGDATHVCQVTTNGKGLTTAQTAVTITGIPASSVPFSGITSATNTIAAMVVGAGASLDYGSTGTIDASNALGHALPSLTTGFLNWSGSAWAFSAATALSFNGSGAGSTANINGTSPAAATDGFNVLWQTTGTTSASAYVKGYGTIKYGFSYVGAVGASATGLTQVGAASTLPANLATPTSTCVCGTNPTSTFLITLKDGASTVGTISLSSSCVATLATTGGSAQTLNVDDQLYAITPASPDATAANISCLVRASRN